MTETIPSEAREAARRLGELFQRDSELAKLQDNALGRLRAANQQLWTGLHPDALSLLYDHTEAVGIRDHARIRSRITAIIADTRAAGGDDHEIETAVLRARPRDPLDDPSGDDRLPDRLRGPPPPRRRHRRAQPTHDRRASSRRVDARRSPARRRHQARSLNSSLTAQSAPALQVAQLSFHAICR